MRDGHGFGEIATRLRETMGLDLAPKVLRRLISDAHETIAPARAAPGRGARDDGGLTGETFYTSDQIRQLADIVETCGLMRR